MNNKIIFFLLFFIVLATDDLTAQNTTDTPVYDSDSVLIEKCNGGPFTFCPNCDSANDQFCFGYTGNDPYKMTIYNRWGIKLFLSEDKEECWDGSGKDTEQPAGTYYFLVNIGDKVCTGTIALLR